MKKFDEVQLDFAPKFLGIKFSLMYTLFIDHHEFQGSKQFN